MKPSLIVLLMPFIAFLSCVPVQKEIYLQKGNERDITHDKIVSTYHREDFKYYLRADDIISIKVTSATPSEFDFLNHPNDRTLTGFSSSDPLLSGFKIEDDGTIPLPVLGKVEVAGLTISQAREKILTIVSDYLESPSVDIKLLSFQFTILGEVEQEGEFTTYNPKISILDAIGKAAGMTDFADRTKLKIVRTTGNNLEVAYVNVLEEDLLSSPFYYLKPGDVITVPPLKAKNWRVNKAPNIALILSALTGLGIFMNWVLR